MPLAAHRVGRGLELRGYLRQSTIASSRNLHDLLPKLLRIGLHSCCSLADSRGLLVPLHLLYIALLPTHEPQPSTKTRPLQTAYIDSVRQAFLKPACVQADFGPDDRHLAAQWHRNRIPIETVRRAIHLGCVRKSCSMIDHPQSQPIRSLRYFRGVLQEVRELSVPDSFRDYVEVSLRRLERRWPDLKS